MPANGFDMYYLQEARNNFDATRPAPVCIDASASQMGQSQNNIHISTNCYYGFHDPINSQSKVEATNDCEMTEDKDLDVQKSTRKRTAAEYATTSAKRLRQGNNYINFLRKHIESHLVII